MGRLIPAFAQYFDGEGNPLANGWLQFLVSTTNNTPKTTYADSDYQIANENPLQLDAEGRCPNVFGTGDYRIISFVNDPEDEDSPGEQIQMFDPVTAQGTSASSGGSGSVFDEWEVAVTYSIGDVVTWNLVYYRSLINSNFGLDPLIQEYAWERVDFIGWYNSTVFYELGDLVYYSDNLWLSLNSSNQGNTPNTSPANWREVASGYKGTVSNSVGYVISTNDREKFIVLTPAAAADETFTLPSVDVTTDRFTLAIYNASDYVLTIDAVGTADIWLNTSGQLDITSGCLIELVYNSLLDTWLPLGGNAGPVLGGQDIGTTLVPVNSIYATDIVSGTLTLTTSSTVPAIYSDEVHLSSDGPIYFGDSDQVSAAYESLANSFVLDVASGVTSVYRVNGVDFWTFEATGEFLPALTNPKAEIGSATNSIDFIYTDNVSLPDSGVIFIGSTDELQMYHAAGNSYVTASDILNISVSGTGNLVFSTNGATAAYIDANQYFYMLNSLRFPNLFDGIFFTAEECSILTNSGSIYIDSKIGQYIVFRAGGSPLFTMASNYFRPWGSSGANLGGPSDYFGDSYLTTVFSTTINATTANLTNIGATSINTTNLTASGSIVTNTVASTSIFSIGNLAFGANSTNIQLNQVYEFNATTHIIKVRFYYPANGLYYELTMAPI